MQEKIIAFIAFCIEMYADKKGLSESEAYHLFAQQEHAFDLVMGSVAND